MVSNYFMEIRMDAGGGGGSLKLEILRGGGLKQFWKFMWKGGGSRHCAFHRGVWIFSGIINHCHLICKIIA